MTRTSDKTLLASLGFQDPDRKDPRHSLACQYLVRPEVTTRVWRNLFPRAFVPCVEEKLDLYRTEGTSRAKNQQEICILKGTGDYRSVVGFIDVEIHLDFEESCDSTKWQPPCHAGEGIKKLHWHRGSQSCAIEVKTTKVDVGDIAKQLGLYQQFYGREDRLWALAATWRLHREEKALLARKGIYVLWLGHPFEEYCAERNRVRNDAFSEDEAL